MHLSPAQPSELPTLVDLINRAYRGTGDNASWNTESGVVTGPRLTLELLHQDLAACPQAHFLAARENPAGPILGTVWLDPNPNGAWYLGLLTVDPTLQKSHLGRQLLTASQDFARDRTANRIEITVTSVRDKLIAWYQRRGYHLTGETKPFPTDGRAGQPQIPNLHFVVMENLL